MLRTTLFCASVCLLAFGAACKAPTNPDSATVARGGLMPVGESAPEIVFAIDQSEVKVLPERTITYDSLDSFRVKLAEQANASSSSGADAAASAGEAAPGGGNDGSLWGAFRSAVGKLTGAKSAKSGKGSSASDESKAAAADASDDTKSPDDDSDESDDDW